MFSKIKKTIIDWDKGMSKHHETNDRKETLLIDKYLYEKFSQIMKVMWSAGKVTSLPKLKFLGFQGSNLCLVSFLQ